MEEREASRRVDHIATKAIRGQSQLPGWYDKDPPPSPQPTTTFSIPIRAPMTRLARRSRSGSRQDVETLPGSTYARSRGTSLAAGFLIPVIECRSYCGRACLWFIQS